MKFYSWGSNSHGQLGQGIQIEQLIIPTQFEINVEAVEVKCITGGGKHTVILTTNNELFTCGDNDKGQLGKELSELSVHRFQSVFCLHKVVKVTCGWDFNLALTDNSEVLGWGSNSFGQLGLPIKKITHLCTPFKIFENKAKGIGAGLRHSVIISSDGSVFASGYGRKGQLGLCLNGVIPLKIDKFEQVKNITNCQEISCGECHCIAKTKNGEFYSWGNNRYGQLGFDPKITRFTTVPIKMTLSVKNSQGNQLFSGWAHNCILTGEGELIIWGRNDFGQLGEEMCDNWKPKIKKFDKKIKQVSLGSHHSVVLMESGEVMSWGWNEHGNCGNDSCENVKTPYKIKNLEKVKVIGSGAAHSFICL